MKDSPIGETSSRTKSEVEILVCLKKSGDIAPRMSERKKAEN